MVVAVKTLYRDIAFKRGPFCCIRSFGLCWVPPILNAEHISGGIIGYQSYFYLLIIKENQENLLVLFDLLGPQKSLTYVRYKHVFWLRKKTILHAQCVLRENVFKGRVFQETNKSLINKQSGRNRTSLHAVTPDLFRKGKKSSGLLFGILANMKILARFWQPYCIKKLSQSRYCFSLRYF